MIGLAESLGAWTLATAVPAFLGLVAVRAASRYTAPPVLAAFALGVFLWFFLDTIQESGDLDVGAGFGGGTGQLGLVLAFAFGLLAFFALEDRISDGGPAGPKAVLAVPFLVALAVGIHGFYEGDGFGLLVSTTKSTDLISAFGGFAEGIGYSLHKMLEVTMVGAVYEAVTFSDARKAASRLRDFVMLSLTFFIPSLVGAFVGFYVAYDASVFLALGGGASVFAALRIAGPLLAGERALSTRGLGWNLKLAAAIAAGFVSIYLAAALLHS